VTGRRRAPRGRLWPVLLTLAALAGAAAWVVASRARTLPSAPLARVPRGAALVLHVDVRALRASEAYRALLPEDAGSGLSRVRETCGFDPLDRVREVTVFASELAEGGPGGGARRTGGLGDLGWIARGERLREESLVACIRAVVEADGGGIVRTEVAGVPAIGSARGRTRAAFVAVDGAAGGDARVVEAVVRVVRDRAPSALGDAELADLWALVAGGSGADDVERDPTPGRALTLVARVPERWREAVARQAAIAPSLAPATTVRALGASVGMGVDLSVGAALRTGSPAEAAALARAISALRDEQLARPLVRLLPVGRALAALEIEARGSDAVLAVDLSVEQARALGPLARALASGGPPPAASEPDAADGGEAPHADGVAPRAVGADAPPQASGAAAADGVSGVEASGVRGGPAPDAVIRR
jgi:hypothetical protein